MINKKYMLKSIIYRMYAFLVTFFITLFITRDLKISLTIGFMESIIKILTYYWFDVIWEKIDNKMRNKFFDNLQKQINNRIKNK